MSGWHIILVFFAHWIADFVLQTDKMALNKSTSWAWLSSHVAVYTIAITAMCWPVLGVSVFGWAAINGGAHLFTDAITSRMTSRLWKAGKRHEFFVVIGLDQFAHAAVLILTLEWLLR